jgi:hypothetical protein
MTRLAVWALVVLLAVQAWFWQARRRRDVVVADVLPGDRVADVRLRPLSGDGPTRTRGARGLFAGSCGVTVFFLSTCPACDVMAPAWSGVDSVTVGGRGVPVAWIGLSADTAAASFLGMYDLAPGYVAKSLHDLARLGVSGTPTVYLLNRGALVARLPRVPSEIEQGGFSCDLAATVPG